MCSSSNTDFAGKSSCILIGMLSSPPKSICLHVQTKLNNQTKYPLKITAHPCGAFTTGGIYTPIMIKRLPSLFSAELGANSMYNRYCNFFCIFCQGRLTDLFLILFLIVASRKDILFSNQSTNRN